MGYLYEGYLFLCCTVMLAGVIVVDELLRAVYWNGGIQSCFVHECALLCVLLFVVESSSK